VFQAEFETAVPKCEQSLTHALVGANTRIVTHFLIQTKKLRRRNVAEMSLRDMEKETEKCFSQSEVK
jgi:hypothetical protein